VRREPIKATGESSEFAAREPQHLESI
jgi:hypothetical protein